MPYEYDYPRPAVAVDLAIVQSRNGGECLLLIKRKNEPFRGKWALPGGFLDMDETLEQAAARELMEETGLAAISIRQFGAFSTVDRDPRGRVISIGFRADVTPDAIPVAADDAADARWFPLDNLPELAFDHAEMIEEAIRRVGKS